VVVSPNGKHVYVASVVSDAVSIFARHKVTGALSQLPVPQGCISEDGSSGLCIDGDALSHPFSVAVSRDGRNVYVGSRDDDAVAVFARDKATGGLSQLAQPEGCISENGSEGICSDGMALRDPRSVAVSGDGRQVYVATQESSAVAVLQRQR
jgi:DNA-binding beta-propeller fold protein YncE